MHVLGTLLLACLAVGAFGMPRAQLRALVAELKELKRQGGPSPPPFCKDDGLIGLPPRRPLPRHLRVLKHICEDRDEIDTDEIADRLDGIDTSNFPDDKIVAFNELKTKLESANAAQIGSACAEIAGKIRDRVDDDEADFEAKIADIELPDDVRSKWNAAKEYIKNCIDNSDKRELKLIAVLREVLGRSAGGGSSGGDVCENIRDRVLDELIDGCPQIEEDLNTVALCSAEEVGVCKTLDENGELTGLRFRLPQPT